MLVKEACGGITRVFRKESVPEISFKPGIETTVGRRCDGHHCVPALQLQRGRWHLALGWGLKKDRI